MFEAKFHICVSSCGTLPANALPQAWSAFLSNWSNLFSYSLLCGFYTLCRSACSTFVLRNGSVCLPKVFIFLAVSSGVLTPLLALSTSHGTQAARVNPDVYLRYSPETLQISTFPGASGWQNQQKLLGVTSGNKFHSASEFRNQLSASFPNHLIATGRGSQMNTLVQGIQPVWCKWKWRKNYERVIIRITRIIERKRLSRRWKFVATGFPRLSRLAYNILGAPDQGSAVA